MADAVTDLLKRRIAALESAYAQQSRALDDLTRQFERITRNGLTGLQAQSGFFQFAGDVARLDHLTMQARVPDNASGFNIISAVDEYQLDQADLDAHHPRIFYIVIRNGTSWTNQIQVNQDGTGYADFDLLDHPGTEATATIGVKSGSVFGSFVTKVTASAAKCYPTDNVFLWLGGRTSDPTYAEDGMLWYRDDLDAFYARVNGATVKLTVSGQNNFGDQSTKTIATGAITVTNSYHLVDTEAAAATDDLDTISGTVSGQVYIFRAANSARTVVFKDGTGNLKLAGDHSLDNGEDTITLISDGTNLYEIARSNNGA